MTEKKDTLVVLIDAENAQASIIEELLSEIAKYGTASVRRIYGDFTDQNLSSWKKTLLAHSINPIQQFRYTSGKNASDSALIIDAMDLLHSKRFDGFCIVSSDSDFTRLAMRIREEGLRVYGFGEKKTPQSFVAACDRFIYTEILRKSPAAPAKPARGPRRKPKAAPSADQVPAGVGLPGGSLPIDDIRDAVEATADETGWAALGRVGGIIGDRRPDFDPRNFGHKNLSALIQATGQFELQRRGTPGQSQSVYLRAKAEP